ncbi:DUF4011 domain-containing protein [bacterium]|nr:DUF4011 domain-containing protein [bacterium]
MTNPISKKLEEARQKLMDLTMRNRLLNFRSPKRKAIKIVDEDPSEIYEMLVLNEKFMEFLPTKEKSAKDYNVRANGDSPSRTIVPDCPRMGRFQTCPIQTTTLFNISNKPASK